MLTEGGESMPTDAGSARMRGRRRDRTEHGEVAAQLFGPGKALGVVAGRRYG